MPRSTPTASLTPLSPTASPSASAQPIVILSDDGDGLRLVSTPEEITLTVGHVAYLPVEIQSQHRPVTVHAQTLIHTFVNDLTPAEPGASPAYEVALLEAGQSELKLQTLRMRPHELTLTFTAGESAVTVSLVLQPAIQPHTPLFGTFYVPNRMTPPYELVYGPDCGACPTTSGDPPGSTRDRTCYRDLADSCRCHYYQWVYDADADERARASAPQMQVFATQFLRNTWAVWGNTEVEPGNYLWSALDWVYTRTNLSSLEQDCSPLMSDVMYGAHGWFSCPEYANPDGSNGFYDVDNTFMLEHFRAYMRALNTRYAAELRFIEMGNEPAAEFYLCPCSAPLDIACDASSGPNQPVCEDGPGSPEFAAVYGDLLFTAADIAAEEMAAINPHALVITGALEMVPTRDTHLTATTEYLIQQGLLENDNVAVGIHQYPYFYPPPWLSDENGSWLNCGYYQPGQDIFWLPDGCETAPPLSGDFAFPSRTTPEKTFTARDLWQKQDERVDLSGLLHDAEALGVVDEIYFFDTELHAGFHDSDPTTSPAREALAGLRIAAINSHQRVIGTEFIFAPGDPAVYNLLVKNLSGAASIYAWDAPLMDADYSGIVYKLFTRGDEDILAIWSNAEAAQWLVFSLHENSTQFKQVTLTTFRPAGEAGGELSASIVVDVTPPAAIQVHPIEEFHFLSVISDRPGFGWLADISVAIEPPPAVTAPPTS
ncbi:MAG: hypothetical protein HY781_03225 [Chloroflexi bacterium]|nr:hypothetical protein [Chloroflexota bacterium]